MEGVTRAASASGTDTDTIASMTGAILGAVNGTEWLMPVARKIQDCNFLADLAKKLWFGKIEEYTFAQDHSTSENYAALLHDLEAGFKDVILPIGSHAKVVGDGGVRWIVSVNELRKAWISYIKEEDLSLTAQKAQQAAKGQRPPVAGEGDMVRLVADGASSKYPCG